MSRIEIHVGESSHIAGERTATTSSSRESSFDDDGEGELSQQPSRAYTSSLTDNEPRPRSRSPPWDEEIDPSDSASASAEFHNGRHRPPPRQHRYSQPRQHYRVPQAPVMSSEPSDDYGYAYGPHHPPFYGPPPQPSYPSSHVGAPPYGPGPGPGPGRYNRQQMVPYQYGNPFQPMGGAGGAAFFGEPRGSPYADMMPYQNGGYFGNGAPYGLPPHMQQYMWNPPPPPPTEIPTGPQTPAPPPPAEKKLDPEVEKMKMELELFKKAKDQKAEEERQRQVEEKIRKDTEDAIQRRMEEMKKAQEEAKKEIEKAKADAERAAKERIEAERKAAEEQRKLHEEAMARAEREARDRIEAERKADELRAKREAEAAAAAEAAAKAKIEAAMKGEAEAKALAAAKAAEEAEWRKKLEEEAKLKAEIEARAKLEAEKKAAEEAAKKAADEAEWRKKLEEEAKLKAEVEARAKLEAEKKAADEAKAAEEAKKQEQEELKKQFLADAKAKAEEAAAKQGKAPIKFKDAVGRKFSFPFHLCQTWAGMEELIKQAFVQIEVIGPHVQEGHYDLIGPNGEIILPSVWEKVIQPDWAITMHMWPIEKSPPLRGHHPGMMGPNGLPMRPGHHIPGGARVPVLPPGMRMPMRPGQVPPPPGFPGRQFAPGDPRDPRDPRLRPANIVNVSPEEKKERKSKEKSQGGVLGWMAGGNKSKGSKKKR